VLALLERSDRTRRQRAGVRVDRPEVEPVRAQGDLEAGELGVRGGGCGPGERERDSGCRKELRHELCRFAAGAAISFFKEGF
jgi:hypothetical protein